MRRKRLTYNGLLYQALALSPNGMPDSRLAHGMPQLAQPRIGTAVGSVGGTQRAMSLGTWDAAGSCTFALTEAELKLCAELPDVLNAIADAHDAKASMAAAIGYAKSMEFHAARADELRTQARRIEECE